METGVMQGLYHNCGKARKTALDIIVSSSTSVNNQEENGNCHANSTEAAPVLLPANKQ